MVAGAGVASLSFTFVAVGVRFRSCTFSFSLVGVRVRCRSRSLSFALVVVRARCRSRSLSFALVVVRVRYRSRSSSFVFVVVRRLFFHRVVTWEVLAAIRKWAVDGDGVASVELVSVKVMRVLTIYINCKTMTTTTKLSSSSSSSSLPRHSLVHRDGAVGCADGGRCWFPWSLVVVWKWLSPFRVVVAVSCCCCRFVLLSPFRVVVAVVRRSWAFVGRLSSFLGGRGRLRGLGLWEVDVVAGWMCIVVVQCVVVVGSVVGTWWLLNEEAMSQPVTLAC